MSPSVKNKYAGIILSAGCSSRMKQWKPAVIINEVPLIYHAIKPMTGFCERIIVVGGYNFIELKKLLSHGNYLEETASEKISIVENKSYESGMLSSVKAGLDVLKEDTDAVFITPGDMPLISKATYSEMINIFESKNTDVLIPQTSVRQIDAASAFRMKKGHPVLAGRLVINEINKECPDSILRDILKRFPIDLFDTDDKGIITDIDTDEDLKKVISLVKNEIKGSIN